MFPNIKNTSSKIMNHMKYKCIRKSHQSFINDKVQLSHVECTLEKIKQLIFVEHHIQSNKVEHDINEHQ